MATKGQATLHGRFAPGTLVRLVKVRDESVLRSEGGEEVAHGTVGDDGVVKFTSGVEVGGRYFICGHDRGDYREVRVRGNTAAEESAVLSQPPVGNVETKTAGGVTIDAFGRVQAPDREATPGPEVAPGPAQHQLPKGAVQASDTPLGAATPLEDPHPVPDSPERQDEATDGKLLQRSDTPHGVTTPIAKAPAKRSAAKKASGRSGGSKTSSARKAAGSTTSRRKK